MSTATWGEIERLALMSLINLSSGRMFFENIVRRLRKSDRNRRSVTIEGNSIFIAQNGAVESSFSFESIKAIQGVSKDMLVSDEIFIVLESGGKWYWVSERDEGFDKISREIQGRFPLRPADWYDVLNRNPPFEQRVIELWRAD